MKNYVFLLLCCFIANSLQDAYNPSLAKEFVRASSKAYCQKRNGGSLAGYEWAHQFESVISPWESVSYSLFVDHAHQKVVFAFRGTQGIAQLALEGAQGKAVQFKIHNIPNGLATEYFYTKYSNNLRGDFLSKVRDMAQRYPQFTFYFTGHSLGGALATLGALDVSLSHILPRSKVHLYTFGSPRVGNVNVANAVSANVVAHWRVVHKRDVVPHVPLCKLDSRGACAGVSDSRENGSVIWHAFHSGSEVFYEDDTRYRICDGRENMGCSNKFKPNELNKDDHGRYLGMSVGC